jgi:hypothetical protein
LGSHGELTSTAVTAAPAAGALRRAGIIAAWGVGGLAVLLAPVKLCMFAVLFHVPCPGCGMTRAALAMLRGDFAHAYTLHPLSIVLVPFVGAIAARQVASYVQTGNAWGAPLPRWIEPIAAALVVLLLGVWVARWCGFLGGPVSV